MSAPVPTPRPRVRRARDVQELFEPQRTSAADLPDPAPLVDSLARGAIEVIAGVREPEQMGRWLAEEPYRALLLRANLATRARSARGQNGAASRRTRYARSTSASPDDGIAEAVVVVDMPPRTRAVAIRLEGIDRRWRATSLAVL